LLYYYVSAENGRKEGEKDGTSKTILQIHQTVDQESRERRKTERLEGRIEGSNR